MQPLSTSKFLWVYAQQIIQVVLLCESSWTDRHPNVTYLDLSAQITDPSTQPIFAAVSNPLNVIRGFSDGLKNFTKLLFDDPVVQSLYKIRKEFDMIVVDEFIFMALYPFVHETTFAKFIVAPLHPSGSANFGNPLNPAFVSSSLEEFPQPYSTWHRFKNSFNALIQNIAFGYIIPRLAAAEIASRFPSIPPPHTVAKNASLLIVNSDFRLEGVFQTLPLVVPVAGLTLKPTKPLPKDISEFLYGDTPAIFVSMGSSYGHSKQIPQVYKDILFSVFSELPYKDLLKFNEHPSQNYENLFIREWFPQQDVFAHPNVRACMCHGGVLTVHEAISHGVPILGMPYMTEHRRMIQTQVHRGQGLLLEWSELSEQKLKESIMEIMQNPSYRQKMAETSRIFKDQRESPLDRAVYWTEYVAKYKGAPHLQSPAKHLTWIEILNLDIIILVIFILYALFKFQMWFICQLISEKSRKR